HALLWLDSGAPMTRESIAAIDGAADRGEVLVSPVAAWEIGLLVQKSRIRLDLEPLPWFERFLGLPGVRLTPLGVAAAIACSFLPEPFHGDSADRLLVATARTLPATLISRDARILSYAEAGHLRTLAC
ncbi:MAG: type II toxin-antitoxin system VapC family toxin, partial [Geminicoccaceae bacterium]